MPALVLALLIGTAVHAFAASARLAPGIAWCSRFLLRAGVALLGLRIGLEQLQQYRRPLSSLAHGKSALM
jgi:uncharacterized membrane protein YadS